MTDEVKLTLVRKPSDIERMSFEIIDSEVPDPKPFAGIEWQIVRRMVHTTADFELIDLVRFHPEAVDAGLNALRSGCLVVTDTEMARCGIPLRRMTPLGCSVSCFMNDPEVIKRAKSESITRATAALDLAARYKKPAIYVIGNAPTALVRLVERIEMTGESLPGLVIGMPVGFVNAEESKRLLINQKRVPYISLEGRKGGSAMAACVVNALAEVVLAERKLSGEIS